MMPKFAQLSNIHPAALPTDGFSSGSSVTDQRLPASDAKSLSGLELCLSSKEVKSPANWRIALPQGTMNLVAAGPAPAERLQTIALGAVALAGVAAAEQAARFVRGFDSVRGSRYASLSVWERIFVDPPNVAGPLIALAAVVLMLLLPVARRFDRARTAVACLVVPASAANLVGTIVYLWMAHGGRQGIVFPRVGAIIIDFLPGYGVSTVLLVLVANMWRWRRAQPGAQLADLGGVAS